jgi:hypothetical protein
MTAAGRRWLKLGLVVGIGLGLGALVRYQVFDTNTLNWLCEGGRGPWWCAVRRAAKTVLQWQGLSLTALAVALYACWRGRFAALLTAAGLGAAGLFLYAPELSAAALLVAGLRLLRPLGPGWPATATGRQPASS